MVEHFPGKFEAGVFLIDKPPDISSFGVVSRMRRILNLKKVGHAGTLDPFATGLLIICAGRPATKLISLFMEGEKEYFATLQLGVETETLDTEGKVTNRCPVGHISSARLEACITGFKGTQMQVPPAYSALKHKGKPLYYYARKGIEITKEPRQICISDIERIDGGGDLAGDTAELGVRVVCSKGTYIRTLAADIGKILGCGAHLRQLRRTRSGCFSIDDSISWKDLQEPDAYSRCVGRMLSVEQVCKMLQ